jgi:hypothetical protein
MSYQVMSAIGIAATPEKVWAVLTDLSNYPQWHPAYKSVTGQLAVGSTLTIGTTSPSTGDPITLKVTVLTVEPDSELTWASKLLGISTIKRRFLLSSADGGTELTQAGTYRGLGGGRGPGGRRGALRTVANLQGSYIAVNEAIKKQAEAQQ